MGTLAAFALRRLARVAAPLLLAAFALAGCGRDAPQFKASDVTGTAYGRDFRLTGHDGKPRTLADFRGKVVVLFFGYTQCPDVCPTTLAELADVMRQLGPDADRVQVLFVTVDPDRDSADLLSKYVPAFNPTFLGLRGDADGDGADGEGIPRLLSEAAGAHARHLHDGPFRRNVRVRSAGTAARLRELRAGAGHLRA